MRSGPESRGFAALTRPKHVKRDLYLIKGDRFFSGEPCVFWKEIFLLDGHTKERRCFALGDR